MRSCLLTALCDCADLLRQTPQKAWKSLSLHDVKADSEEPPDMFCDKGYINESLPVETPSKPAADGQTMKE